MFVYFCLCIITWMCFELSCVNLVYVEMSMCMPAAEEISSSCKLNSAPSLDSPCWASLASCVCFGTRSWLVCRSDWYSGWSPGGAPETDTCWTKTPSPVPASGALCRDTASSSHSWLLTSFPLSFLGMHHLGENKRKTAVIRWTPGENTAPKFRRCVWFKCRLRAVLPGCGRSVTLL